MPMVNGFFKYMAEKTDLKAMGILLREETCPCGLKFWVHEDSKQKYHARFCDKFNGRDVDADASEEEQKRQARNIQSRKEWNQKVRLTQAFRGENARVQGL